MSAVESNSAFVAEMTSAAHSAIAAIHALSTHQSPHRRIFSRDVVRSLLDDVWPDVITLIRYLIVDPRKPDLVASEVPVTLGLDLLKYALSASLFLRMAPQVIRRSARAVVFLCDGSMTSLSRGLRSLFIARDVASACIACCVGSFVFAMMDCCGYDAPSSRSCAIGGGCCGGVGAG